MMQKEENIDILRINKRDVTCGESLNEEELKTILKSAIIDLTRDEQETLLHWIKEMKLSKEKAQ
jgi:hypothetical protein